MVLPLFVGRETSVLAIEAALAQDRLIFLATQKDQSVENPEAEDIQELLEQEDDSAGGVQSSGLRQRRLDRDARHPGLDQELRRH